MAESYSCSGRWVYFSSEACQTLQLTWARIADMFPDDPVMHDLSSAFKTISRHPTGVSAAGIDNEFLDEPLCNEDVKKAWLNVMNILINDLEANGSIMKEMDVNWDDELRRSWLERLILMRDCLEGQIRV